MIRIAPASCLAAWRTRQRRHARLGAPQLLAVLLDAVFLPLLADAVDVVVVVVFVSSTIIFAVAAVAMVVAVVAFK